MSTWLDRLRARERVPADARSSGRRLLLGITVVLMAALPVLVRTTPAGVYAGRPALRTYRAPHPVRMVDAAATEAARRVAVARVAPVTRFDPRAAERATSEVHALFALVSPSGPSGRPRADSLLRAYPDALDARTAAALVTLPTERVASLGAETEAAVRWVMAAGIAEDDLEDARARIIAGANGVRGSELEREVVVRVASWALRPNLVVDVAATAAARADAAKAIAPVIVTKQAGETIVEQGEVVTETQMAVLKRLGLLAHAPSWQDALGAIVLMSVLVGVAAIYLAVYERRVWTRFRDVTIVAALFVSGVYLTRLAGWIAPDTAQYLMPAAAAAMLATLLVNARAGVLTAVCVAAAGVLLGAADGPRIVAMLLAGVIASVAMARITQRRHLLHAATTVVGSLGLLGFSAGLAASRSLSAGLAEGGWGIVEGLIASILAYGLLPVFEAAFGVTTDVRLLELANTTSPLMKDLMIKAPGTYSHSVMTASLAEAAAEEIHASPLLARVGAFYHDVGKMRRPEFFVENQHGGENPHEGTTPAMSALIITAHVREGVELARTQRLPDEVVDIIHEHHGTSLVSYFYNKAHEGDAPVYEADFRYAGRIPSTREAALVMLADSVEAAVRCIGKPSLPRIEAAVRKVVDGKMSDGQLDDAQLTLAEIETVVKVYARMLVGIYHPRIDYPEALGSRGSERAGQCYQPSRP